MGDVPWKGQHGAKRLVKEFRHISEQIEKGMLPQVSNLTMHLGTPFEQPALKTASRA